MKHLLKKSICFILVSSLLGIVLTGCGAKNTTVKITHKNFTEQRILGQMFAVMIENNSEYKTEVKELGGTNICLEAIKSGNMDLYPDYTGTAYTAILQQDTLNDPQEIYEYVKSTYKKQFDIEWLDPLGFNNTYTFAVRPEVAEKYNLKTFSDLSKVASELRFIVTAEFLERADGLPGVQSTYGGFEFKQVNAMDPGLRYTAIKENAGDVMDAFSTDGKIIEYGLVILEDDKKFFPPYYVAPLVNGKFASKHPEIVDILNQLANQIDEEAMQKMNFQVDEQGMSERDIAEAFLKSKGFIK